MRSQPKLAQMKIGDYLDGYLYVERAEARTAPKSGKDYWRMDLCDATRMIDAKMWESLPETLPQSGDVVRVTAQLDVFKDVEYLKVTRLRALTDEDSFDKKAIVPPSGGVYKRTQPRLADVKNGDGFRGYLLVRTIAQRDSSAGKPYWNMTLCDISGEVNAMMWAPLPEYMPSGGEIIYLSGTMQEYKEKPQFKVNALRPLTDDDAFDMNMLTPCAPRPAEDMRTQLFDRIERISDAPMRALVKARLEECGEALNYYPAAKSLHHAEKSGLLHHTSTMLELAEKVCEVYPSLDGDLLCAGVILHDLCKIEEMDADANGISAAYTPMGELLGHLVAGVARLQILAQKLQTPQETVLLLSHMILSHHDLPEYGSPKPPMFPEAEVLHALDVLDARMFEMSRELDKVKPGGFTDRIWSLDRKLYRRKTQNAEPEVLPADDPLTKYLDSLPEIGGVPGCELIVMKGTRMVYHHTVNAAPTQMYWLFSVSKVMTSTALMQLIECGKVHLNDPVSKYVPAFASCKVKTEHGVAPAQTAMTIEHLMTMQGGLDYELDAPGLMKARLKHRDELTTQQGIEAIAEAPLNFEPGTHFLYSLCHDVAAAVVEKASGLRFGEYLRKYILEPLEIEDVTLHPDRKQLSRIAPYYRQNAAGVTERVEPYNEYAFSRLYESGGAGLFACAEGFAKFMCALANGGVGANGKRILRAETIDEMRTNHLTGTSMEEYRLFDREGYGYGLGVRTRIEKTDSPAPIGEFGWGGAAGALVIADPKNHISAVYLQHVRDYARDVENQIRIRDLIYEQFADET